MGYFSPKDVRVLHKAQLVWGTEAAEANYAIAHGTNEPDIEYELNVHESGQVTGQRWKLTTDTRTDMKGALPKITQSGETVFKSSLANHLYSFCQQVTEGETTPFSKTFTCHDTQPAFTSNAGFFRTIVLQNPEASTDLAFKDCVANQITFTLDGPKGELMYDVGFTSRGSGSAAHNHTGTIYRVGSGSFSYEDMDRHTVAINGGEAKVFQPVGAITMAFTQDIIGVGVDSAGDGRVESYLLTNKAGTLSCEMNFDHRARTLKHAKDNDYAVVWNIGWGNVTPGTDDGDLDFAFSSKITSFKENFGGDVYTCDIECAIGAPDNTGELFTIVMADAIDKGW